MERLRISDSFRQFYDDRTNSDGTLRSGGRVIGMGDAIHLATALQVEVAEMQTLDGAGKRKRKYDLLALDGNVADAHLAIKLPTPRTEEGPYTGSGRKLAASFQRRWASNQR